MVIEPNFEKMLEQLSDKDDVRVYDSFEQEWGNGGTGFAAPWQACGQAITNTNVAILENDKEYFVFINNKLCYQVDKCPEIEIDIKRGFIESRYNARRKYKNVYWKE